MKLKDTKLYDSKDEFNREWKAFVEDHPHATPFHTQSWKHAIESAFGYPSRYRIIRISNSDGVAGVVPSFDTAMLLGENLTLPFAEYGYPLLTSDIDPINILDSLSKDVGSFGAYIVKDAPWSGITGYKDTNYGGVITGLTFRLTLDETYDQLSETRFDGEVRRAIKNARESDVKVRTAGVEEYYPIYVLTMRRLSSPQFPKSFFESLTNNFGEYCTVLVAERHGKIIAGIMTLATDDITVIWSNASNADCWDYTPNHLLYATAVRIAIEQNQAVVDFGRTEPGSGVHHFKAQFGGNEFPLVSFVTPPHRVSRASLTKYRRLEPLIQRFSPIITHEKLGPVLKKWVHE